MPTPEWRARGTPASPRLRQIDRIWKPGYSIQLAIGQGDLTVTPLQMARFYAMIANGGKLVTPHLAEDVEQSTGAERAAGARAAPLRRRSRRRRRRRPDRARDRPAGPLRGDALADRHLVRRLRQLPGRRSPARRARAEKIVTLPGDTTRGSSTSPGGAATARTTTPTIVVCAVIENGGHGGTAAAPAALKVFEQYFNEDRHATTHASTAD